MSEQRWTIFACKECPGYESQASTCCPFCGGQTQEWIEVAPAAEAERLRAENGRLREALEEVAEWQDGAEHPSTVRILADAARAALEGSESMWVDRAGPTQYPRRRERR